LIHPEILQALGRTGYGAQVLIRDGNYLSSTGVAERRATGLFELGTWPVEGDGGIDLEPVGRFEFYEAARSPNLALVIATGEQRVYANILLTIGVIPPA